MNERNFGGPSIYFSLWFRAGLRITLDSVPRGQGENDIPSLALTKSRGSDARGIAALKQKEKEQNNNNNKIKA